MIIPPSNAANTIVFFFFNHDTHPFSVTITITVTPAFHFGPLITHERFHPKINTNTRETLYDRN